VIYGLPPYSTVGVQVIDKRDRPEVKDGKFKPQKPAKDKHAKPAKDKSNGR
jgi:hypothetical protein